MRRSTLVLLGLSMLVVFTLLLDFEVRNQDTSWKNKVVARMTPSIVTAGIGIHECISGLNVLATRRSNSAGRCLVAEPDCLLRLCMHPTTYQCRHEAYSLPSAPQGVQKH